MSDEPPQAKMWATIQNGRHPDIQEINIGVEGKDEPLEEVEDAFYKQLEKVMDLINEPELVIEPGEAILDNG